MKLSRVEASSMQEALTKIRATLGDDAQIVGTRTYRRGGVFGVCGKEVVEVYVADTRQEKTERERLATRQRRIAELARAKLAEGGAGQNQVEELSRMLGTLRQEIKELALKRESDGFDHPFLREAYQLLVQHDVEPKLAERLVWELKSMPLPLDAADENRVRTVMKAQMRKVFLPNVPTGLPAESRTIVLIGPTGVGKTTTIAKLAARAKINERKRVGLITLDTFRIAAVDQLSKYARIIGIDLEVVSDPVEFRSSVGKLTRQGAELILVDTAGRGQRDELKMQELRECLSVVPNAEVHLVLSTTTHPRTIRNIARRFSGVGFHRLILTKLDETESFGSLVGVLSQIDKPVSFLTDGQNVPDDIMTSDPDRLSELVFRANDH